ncbi:MAG: GNAT family N-acetyltransferase [Bacilli bacterium]|jgi:predicted acetyltransferase|nr:GNAT family N-acetyltransferase [Bacilli bacterium]HHU23655.1 GNAT family N-acetyltransferase [Acholeplasmataceae bacterium]
MKFSDKFDLIQNENISLKITEKVIGSAEELPYYYYDIYLKSEAKQIGKISIRIGHNKHSYYNGNIGYEINENYRGKKYSLEACSLVLQVAKHHNMDYLYLTSDESNIPSQKIIEYLGANYIETIKPPKDYIFYHDGIPAHKIYRLDL